MSILGEAESAGRFWKNGRPCSSLLDCSGGIASGGSDAVTIASSSFFAWMSLSDFWICVRATPSGVVVSLGNSTGSRPANG